MNLRQYIKGDRIIWSVIIILFAVSLLSVYSSTGSLAYKNMSGDTMHYLFRQLKFIVFGLLLIFIVHQIPYRYYAYVSGLVLIVSIPILLYTLLHGPSINAANRWLYIPGMGIRTFQPSELAKVALIMYLSWILSVSQDSIKKDLKGFILKFIIPIGLVCMLILPANFSTAAIIFATSLIVLYVGRVPLKHLFLFVGIGGVGLVLFLLIFPAKFETIRDNTWGNRWTAFATGEGDNFQADQAKVAVVKGGILPKGPGTSTQRNLLPHPYSDFIFAIVIEEYGAILGGLLLIALYLWLLFRAGIIVRRSKSPYGALLAFGLSLMLVFQAFINMGVTVGLLPVTGQTLPLVSMGGTSMIFTSIALGMILSVSWGVRKELEDDTQEEENSDVEIDESVTDKNGAIA